MSSSGIWRNGRIVLKSLSFMFLFYLAWENTCWAVTVEEQLSVVHRLTFGPFIRVGVGLATVAAAILAIAKHSIGMMFAVIGAGLALSYYLSWLNSHNFAS